MALSAALMICLEKMASRKWSQVLTDIDGLWLVLSWYFGDESCVSEIEEP